MYDLHTHTVFSDGELLPSELVRRASVLGYRVLGITDHVDASNISSVLSSVLEVVSSSSLYGVHVIAGVEITHVPPDEIAALAKRAKDEGAGVVIVHGETVTEPVCPGTNMAACSSSDVDILAHPGFLTEEEGFLAAENGVAVEITGRGGHNRTNGHVLKVAKLCGCRIVVDSDAHGPGDLMDSYARKAVAMGAGMDEISSNSILSMENIDWMIKS
ncbi:histidinol phosphate phosphatase domain-containing protein [Methanoplanus endosymbiosus]|uniref:Histidinol phosphate phosphatase domain-containing protein n=1 Tax=Methanoplanus endosymbiosus TaxID=33865 RepID=A0A9E7PN80_9EURY|nr:histidinol phosphate phosphatase domain-containing protein [Methanoplanus endosymbiosus]UUX93364.1 histidinol phosphate phosphatase domain-containing protein [Methanoplanus endosymbiosus]